MPFLTSTVDLCWLGGGRYELLEPLVYQGHCETFTVPADYRTDLATTPRAVRWLMPSDGPWSLAAILHDWLITDGIPAGLVTSRDTDGLFRRLMREAGVRPVLRWIGWTGVRWGALANPARRRGWWRDAPAVLALSLIAAPLVVPASLVVLAALALYGLAELLVSLIDRAVGSAR